MATVGLIALIGRPNAGKSKLLNRLIGEKISIVSDKPQTTRHRILGIRTTERSQLIFVDTPGVHRPGHSLNRRMMETVYAALKEVDLLVHMVDASESYGKGEQYVLNLVKSAAKPSLLVLNKVDLINKGKLLPMIDSYRQKHDYREIIPLSALAGDNVDVLLEKITENLPKGELLYPSEWITDQQERSIIAEIIREKVLAHTREELPYATAVQLEEFDESRREAGFVPLTASIIVEKQNQKKIVVGRAGNMVKTIGIEARRDIEKFLGVRKVYLSLNVRAIEDWRDREDVLNQVVVR